MARTPDNPSVIAYVASQLPKRSETFVYREVLGLRGRGRKVVSASVRPPEEELGDAKLDALAAEAVVVYGSGFAVAGLLEALRSPGALCRGAADAVLGRGLSFSQRGKTLVQTLGGLALARRLRGLGVTHLHAHMAHVPTTIAMVAAHALGVPFSFTGHAADLFRDQQLVEPKLRRARFVSCISYWHRAYYRELVPGLPEDRLPVIRCGVDIDDFVPTPERPGAPEVLAVGRLVAKKGFDVLLEAWAGGVADARSSGSAEEPMLTLIGDGPEEESLSAQVKRLGLEDSVRMVGGLPNPKVREYMAGCAAFVLPCRPASDGDRDGIPVVLMEAMACGKPVISGDLPAIRELVEDDHTGMLVPTGDVAALKVALSGLLDDETLRRRLGDSGRGRVVEEFSLDTNLGRLEAVFDAPGNSRNATDHPKGQAQHD